MICRDCAALTSGDCGKHGPRIIGVVAPAIACPFCDDNRARLVQAQRRVRFLEEAYDSCDRDRIEVRAEIARLLQAVRNSHIYHRCPAATGGEPCELCLAIAGAG